MKANMNMEESKSTITPSGVSENHRSDDNNDSFSYGDTISLGSKLSQSTWRDTEIDEDMASNLLKMQNLSSIVNDPKGDSLLRQMQHLIGKGGSLDYKELKEHKVPDSYSLPKI